MTTTTRRVTGRKPIITPAKAARIVKRYWLGKRNSQKVICAEEGVCPSTVQKLVRGWRPARWGVGTP